MRNNKFSVGQKVFYTDLNYKAVCPRIIQGIDHGSDDKTVYWMMGYFGYYCEDMLYPTHQQAVDALNHFKAFRDRMSDERNKAIPEESSTGVLERS
jgi:hypothetical protein